jgi:hypothetical protein
MVRFRITYGKGAVGKRNRSAWCTEAHASQVAHQNPLRGSRISVLEQRSWASKTDLELKSLPGSLHLVMRTLVQALEVSSISAPEVAELKL